VNPRPKSIDRRQRRVYILRGMAPGCGVLFFKDGLLVQFGMAYGTAPRYIQARSGTPVRAHEVDVSEALDTRIYRRHPSVSFTRFDEEMLVVVPLTAYQLVLNGTGARVFELLDGQRSIGDLAGAMAAEYEGASAADIAADIRAILLDLEDKGAVQQTGS
jgi:hypothetical protein